MSEYDNINPVSTSGGVVPVAHENMADYEDVNAPVSEASSKIAPKKILSNNLSPSSSYNASGTLHPGSMPELESALLGALKGSVSPEEGVINKFYPNAPKLDFNNVQAVKDNPMAYKYSQIPGNMIGTGALLAATPEVEGPILAGKIAPWIANAGIQGLANAGLSYAQSDKHPVAETLFGGLAGAGGRMLGDSLGALTKSDFRNSPEQIKSLLAAQMETGRTPVNLNVGDLAGSPMLQSHVQKASYLPGSNIATDAVNTEYQLNDRAAEIMHDMAPELHPDISEQEGDKLQNYHQIFDTTKNAFQKTISDNEGKAASDYADVAKRAEDMGVVGKKDNYISKAKELLDQNDSIGAEYPHLKYDSGTRSMLQDIVNSENSSSNKPGFNVLTKAIQGMNQIGRDEAKNPYVVSQLNHALRQDLDDSMSNILFHHAPGYEQNSSTDKLLKDWKDTQSFYKNEVVPYKDLKYDNEGQPISGEEYIKKMVQKGALANPKLAARLVKGMPEISSSVSLVKDGQNLSEMPGMAYLLSNSKPDSVGNIAPDVKSIVKAYGSLGSKARTTLFPKSKQSLDNLEMLHNASKDSINKQVYQPNNGALAARLLGSVGLGGAGAYQGYQIGKDQTNGSMLGGFVGGGLGALGSTLLGRGAGGVLNSQGAIRDAIIKNGGYIPKGVSSLIKNNPNAIPSVLSGVVNEYQ